MGQRAVFAKGHINIEGDMETRLTTVQWSMYADVNITFALPIAISPISTHLVHDAGCFTAKLPTFETRGSYYYRFLMAVAVRCFNHIRLRRGWNCLCNEN